MVKNIIIIMEDPREVVSLKLSEVLKLIRIMSRFKLTGQVDTFVIVGDQYRVLLSGLKKKIKKNIEFIIFQL